MRACFWLSEIPVLCFLRELLSCSEELPALVAVVCGAMSCASSTLSDVSSGVLFVPRGTIIAMVRTLNAWIGSF